MQASWAQALGSQPPPVHSRAPSRLAPPSVCWSLALGWAPREAAHGNAPFIQTHEQRTCPDFHRLGVPPHGLAACNPSSWQEGKQHWGSTFPACLTPQDRQPESVQRGYCPARPGPWGQPLSTEAPSVIQRVGGADTLGTDP